MLDPSVCHLLPAEKVQNARSACREMVNNKHYLFSKRTTILGKIDNSGKI